MKILRKILFPVLMVATLFTACKKDDNKPFHDDRPSRTSHKVIFKATGSNEVNLTHWVAGYDESVTRLTNMGGLNWESPEEISPASAINLNVLVKGTGASSSATLKVQIIVDGEVKAESNAAGTVLSVSATYRF